MTVLTGLSAAKIGQLSAAQIKALTTSDIAGLTAAQLPGLTAAQLALLTPAQLAGFSKAQIGYLSVSAIGGLTPVEIALLSTSQVSGLTVQQIAGLSVSQVKALSTTQLAALSIGQVGALSAADIAALSPAQIAGLSSSDIGALNTTQLKVLSAAQLAALSTNQLAALGAAQIGALAVNAVTGFTTSQIAALSTAQFAGLTAAQFGALSGAQIGALSTADIRSLSTARIASLTGAQLAGLTSGQINSMSAAQLGSLNITYNSMLALLQADAAGGMTAAKLGALQALVGKFNMPGGIAVSGYLQQISDDVVLGNAANATWTGGTHPTGLGNLNAASSQTQVNELIGKWFLGTDLPGSTVAMSGAPSFSVSYSEVSQPLFASGGPRMSDINQGYLGDCFVLAPLAEMAAQDPSAIQSMITSNGNNTYSVRFEIGGKDDYVTVDDKLADGGAIFNHAADSWAGLIEKAYAQLQAGGAVTGNSVNFGNSFSSIASGGAPEATLEEFTGAATITDFDASGTSWSSNIYNGASLTTPGNPGGASLQSFQNGLSQAAVQSALIADLAAGDDLILSSFTGATDKNGNTTLVADHAMAVYGFDSATNLFEIYNPWGTWSGGPQTWDTSFEIGLGTLLADGDTISVAANAPMAGGTNPPLLSSPQPSANHLGLAAPG